MDETKIPKGMYCYDENGVCPYWSLNPDQPKQRNGYCSFLKRGDWEVDAPADAPADFPDSVFSLLWDQCKECGINKDNPLDCLGADPEWLLLTVEDGRSNTGECGERMASLNQRFGEDMVAYLVETEWARLDENARRNICYAVSNTKGMTKELAIKLFEHPQSGVHERHLIVAGLAASEVTRNLGDVLYGMAERIGTYANPKRQEILDGFLAHLNGYKKERETTSSDRPGPQ